MQPSRKGNALDNLLKEKLLLRKFSSIEYIEELAEYYGRAVNGLKRCLDAFDQNPPQQVDWQSWPIWNSPEIWKIRVLPNFERTQQSLENGLAKAVSGDFSYIEGVTGSMQGLSKDMDGIGWDWLKYLDQDLVMEFSPNLGKAEEIASNIWLTVGDYWRPGEILNEQITGLIDEQDLLRYLQPGEQVS